MKTLKKLFALIIFLSILLGGVYFFYLLPKYVVPILMYHRFGYEDSSLFVSPENFERQMAYIKGKGYKVISLDELVKGIENKRNFNHKTVVFTIDDGYRDNYIYAYPVLKKYAFPATIFIISDYIGNNKDFMTWEQIETMRESNISFGGHTKNQVYLPDIEKKVILWDEIAGCKRAIQNRIGRRINYFCYPTGGFTEEIKEIVRISGYKGACTTNRGFAQSNKDLYELKRIKITNSDTNKPLSFRAKLSGYYNLFRSKKSGN